MATAFRAPFLVVALLSMAASASATLWIVDPGGGGDFTAIQEAIDAAAGGDEILVNPGVYYESLNFLGKILYVHSATGPDVTTIDASQSGSSCAVFEQGEPPSTILEGFTLTHGIGIDCVEAGGRAGGGAYCDLSSPTFRDCRFFANSANNGAAIYTRNGSPEISSCEFYSNFSAGYGGAISCSSSSPSIYNCHFESNTAVAGDGTIHLTIEATIEDCVFLDNDARQGGAINCGHGPANAQIRRCLFVGNRATGVHGGAIRSHEASPYIEECVFIENWALEDGGGFFAMDGGIPQVIHCTFYRNAADRYGGNIAVWYGTTLILDNSIVVEATAGAGVFCSNADVTCECNDAWGNIGGNYSGMSDPTGWNGNISADPLFCDPGLEDLALQECSPCAPGHNPDCGLIGALPVGCGGTPVVVTSWGRMKALFER